MLQSVGREQQDHPLYLVRSVSRHHGGNKAALACAKQEQTVRVNVVQTLDHIHHSAQVRCLCLDRHFLHAAAALAGTAAAVEVDTDAGITGFGQVLGIGLLVFAGAGKTVGHDDDGVFLLSIIGAGHDTVNVFVPVGSIQFFLDEGHFRLGRLLRRGGRLGGSLRLRRSGGRCHTACGCLAAAAGQQQSGHGNRQQQRN